MIVPDYDNAAYVSKLTASGATTGDLRRRGGSLSDLVGFDVDDADFADDDLDLVLEAFFLARGMTENGSQRCLAYLANIDECERFEKILAKLFGKYYGEDVWIGSVHSGNEKYKDE